MMHLNSKLIFTGAASFAARYAQVAARNVEYYKKL